MFTTDSRRPARDERLDAVRLERATASGRRWLGDLQSAVEFLSEPIPDLDTPLTDPRPDGRRLTAEVLERVADLGERWVGQLREHAGNVRDDDDEEGEEEESEHAEAYKKATGEDPPSARDRRERREKRTRDAFAYRPQNSMRDKRQAESRLLANINAANRRAVADGVWSGKTRTQDAALPPVPDATTQERIAAINSANRAFWARR